MNNWNSTTNGNNPSIEGTYVVTVEYKKLFGGKWTPARYVRTADYLIKKATMYQYEAGWYFWDDINGEPTPVSDLEDHKIVAWQPMPEAYMGE